MHWPKALLPTPKDSLELCHADGDRDMSFLVKSKGNWSYFKNPKSKEGHAGIWEVTCRWQSFLTGYQRSGDHTPGCTLSVSPGFSPTSTDALSAAGDHSACRNPQVVHQDAAVLLAQSYLMSMSASPWPPLSLSLRAVFLAFLNGSMSPEED